MREAQVVEQRTVAYRAEEHGQRIACHFGTVVKHIVQRIDSIVESLDRVVEACRTHHYDVLPGVELHRCYGAFRLCGERIDRKSVRYHPDVGIAEQRTALCPAAEPVADGNKCDRNGVIERFLPLPYPV